MRLPGVVMRHRGIVVVALVVVGIVTAVLVTVRAGIGDNRGQSEAGPATTDQAAPGAAELVRLLGRSATVNFDVAYNVAAPGGPATAHLWRRPPLARLDTQSGTGDGVRRESLILSASGPVSCTQASGAWSCAPKPGLNLGSIDVVPPSLAAQLSSLDISARDDQILGERVRCFTLSPSQAEGSPGTAPAGAGAEPAELCVTPDGIPARVLVGPTQVDMVSLQRGRLPDSVFEPPAPVG